MSLRQECTVSCWKLFRSIEKLQATYDVIVLIDVKKRGPCYSCDDRSLVVIDDGLMSAYGWACDNRL
jgi:hypothetical protein